MTKLPRSARARSCTCAAIIALAAIGATVAAKADPPGPAYWLYERGAMTTFERGQFYAGFTLNAGVQQLPRFNSNFSVFGSGLVNPFLGPGPLDNNDVVGVQPGGEIGYVFRDGTFPAWMGNRLRVGLYGSASSARSTESQSTGIPNLFATTYYGVNGTQAASAGIFIGNTLPTTLVERLEIHRDAFQVGVKLESDMALGPNLSLTPAFAIFGGRAADSYVYTGVIQNPGAVEDILPNGINERLRTNEAGGHVGARLTWQFQPGWAVHFGGTAGGVWMRSRLTASDCIGLVAPIGTPCGPSNQLAPSTSATDSRSTAGFRGTASLGLAVDLRYAVVSLGGFMRYDSRIPGIVNPQLTSLAASGTTLAPAHVRFDDGFAYGGFLTLRVPIPY